MTPADTPEDLREQAQRHRARLTPIQLVMLDVDGVLTDGRITWVGGEVGWSRTFHTGDGFGIKLLRRAGLEVGVISADDNPAMTARVQMLGLTHVYLGTEDKRGAWFDVRSKTGLADEQVLFMGDELFDLPLLRRAGFSATVPAASLEVREAVHYVTRRGGGHGAVREVIDLLRYARGLTPNIPDFD